MIYILIVVFFLIFAFVGFWREDILRKVCNCVIKYFHVLFFFISNIKFCYSFYQLHIYYILQEADVRLVVIGPAPFKFIQVC